MLEECTGDLNFIGLRSFQIDKAIQPIPLLLFGVGKKPLHAGIISLPAANLYNSLEQGYDENTSLKDLSPLLGGAAGEYFVAAELSKRGYVASITMRNTKGMDVLCSNANATRTVGIQVKTNKSPTREWMLNQKAEDYFADNLFYAFVNLNDGRNSPDYFIVPSKTVATYAKTTNAEWLSQPGRNGRPHVNSTMRKFHDPQEEFLGRWDLLGL